MQVSGQLHALLINSCERTLIATERQAGWAQESVWMFGEREKSLSLLGFEPQIAQPVT